MGSSKKHKEKDKDRDRERRREKDRKHRDRDKEREKDGDRDKRRHDERHREKRAHGSDEETERIEKKKSKREEYDDLYEYAIEESAREDRSEWHRWLLHVFDEYGYVCYCFENREKSLECQINLNMLFALAKKLKPWHSLTGSDAQPKQEGGDISLSIEETKYVHCSYSFMFTYSHFST